MILRKKIYLLLSVFLFTASSIFSSNKKNITEISENDEEPDEIKKPNILIILADDLGYSDISAYGGEISTPNLDSLIANGMQFSNFHVSGLCAPTRSMLLTGVDNHLTGYGNMLEVMTDEQKGNKGYEGYLNDDVVTIATMLNDGGYNTYMAGKWHQGERENSLPVNRGFDSSVSLMESGADNWEKKAYIPSKKTATFFEDHNEFDLPENFYSSDFYVDKLMEYVDCGKEDTKPFFSYLSFQAVHMPHQAPEYLVDKYINIYKKGWEEIRKERTKRIAELNLLPERVKEEIVPEMIHWADLSSDEQKYASKQMAVYAAMTESMDNNIGRFLDYLKGIGEYENTVIFFLSDNGTDRSTLEKLIPNFYKKNFDCSYENLGKNNSFSNYGPGWAWAAATPLYSYKGSAHEGGMRVPFTVSYPGFIEKGSFSDSFGFVKDIVPTILDLAGIEDHNGIYNCKEVFPVSGRSMYKHLISETDFIHTKDEIIAYELAGSIAVFKGDFKLQITPAHSEDSFQLYNILDDPFESINLVNDMPELVTELKNAYGDFVVENNIIEVPDDYDGYKQFVHNALREKLKGFAFRSLPFLIVIFISGGGVFFLFRKRNRDKAKLNE